jgi:hypothetical protein
MTERPIEPDESRTRATAADSARRAAGEVRRYIRGNRLDHLWTFTFAQAVHDYAELGPIVEAFERRLRASGWNGAIVLVPEPHPKGHGWHLHGAVRGRFPIRLMAQLWRHGHVFVVGSHGKSRGAWRSRRLSSYLSKYLTKELAPDELHGCTPRPKGTHRYWRTQGFDPPVEVLYFDTLAQAERWLDVTMGPPDVRLALQLGDAFRPEGWWLQWDDPPR